MDSPIFAAHRAALAVLAADGRRPTLAPRAGIDFASNDYLALAGSYALAEALAQGAARGVFAITRHPMMWGFALWALAHGLVMPTQGQIVLSASIAFLALVGSAGQDREKERLKGGSLADWAARTSFLPFARQIGGVTPWGDTVPRGHALLGGILLWLAATWAHGALGYMVAGVWRWIG